MRGGINLHTCSTAQKDTPLFQKQDGASRHKRYKEVSKMLLNSRKKGFTLVELMVVVVIIGVLAAMAVVRFKSARERVKIAQAKLWVNRIAKAVETLGAETGEWPGHTPAGYICYWGNNEVWDLNSPRAGIVRDDDEDPFPGWAGPYMETVPLDPWGNKYFIDTDYYPPGTHKWAAVVGSFGPNGRGRNVYDDDNIYVIISTEELPAEYYTSP